MQKFTVLEIIPMPQLLNQEQEHTMRMSTTTITQITTQAQ